MATLPDSGVLSVCLWCNRVVIILGPGSPSNLWETICKNIITRWRRSVLSRRTGGDCTPVRPFRPPATSAPASLLPLPPLHPSCLSCSSSSQHRAYHELNEIPFIRMLIESHLVWRIHRLCEAASGDARLSVEHDKQVNAPPHSATYFYFELGSM